MIGMQCGCTASSNTLATLLLRTCLGLASDLPPKNGLFLGEMEKVCRNGARKMEERERYA